MSQSDNVTVNNPAEADTAKIIYILYLVGWFIPVISAIVGLVMAYMNRAAAPAWVQSHYELQIRTFWIALPCIIIGTLVATYIINFIGWLIFVLTIVWWIVRCVKGLKALFDGAPYPNPTTWLW